MPELIFAVSDYAGWLYLMLVVLGLREVAVLVRSGREHDLALFGLEREAATGRALRSLITLFLLSTIGLGVYLVSNVLAPALPEHAARLVREAAPLVETPPTVMLPTDTPLPPTATSTRSVPRIVTAVPETPESVDATVPVGLCRNPDLEIVSPEEGAVVERSSEVVVTARFDPDSGRRFWLELAAGAAEGGWRVLGPVHTQPAQNAAIGRLPDDLTTGRYFLRLLLSEPSGDVLPDNVCQVLIRVR